MSRLGLGIKIINETSIEEISSIELLPNDEIKFCYLGKFYIGELIGVNRNLQITDNEEANKHIVRKIIKAGNYREDS